MGMKFKYDIYYDSGKYLFFLLYVLSWGLEKLVFLGGNFDSDFTMWKLGVNLEKALGSLALPF
jgi:hypothetical protein